MPTIPLSTALGLQVDGSLTPGAKLLKILPDFPKFKDLRLDQVAFKQADTGLVFDEPLSVSIAPLQMQAGANASSSLGLIGEKDRTVDEDDPFNGIAVNPGEIYMALGLSFSLQGGVSFTVDSGTFGLSGERDLAIKCYRRFQSEAGAFPTFAKALADTTSSFVFPKATLDLNDFPGDTVCVFSGDGVLAVTGGFTVGTPVQTLASVSLPMGKTLSVNPSGSFETMATLTFTGGYEIRLRRLAQRKIEIGIYTLKSRQLAVSIVGEAGVSALVGTSDLAEKFLKALSRQPLVDVDEFRRALPGEDPAAREEQIEGIQKSLKQAISTQVQASVMDTLATLKSNESAWLFEIDLDAAVSPAAEAAVAAALQGDFRPLTTDPAALPAGITQTENVLTRTDLRRQALQVNILGMANYLSVAKLLRVSAIEHSATGAITLITDTSSASRLQALTVFAALDDKRLRKMLSENFLIEAAYHASGLGVLPPEFLARHSYFRVRDNTGVQDMRDELDVARVLGLISPDEEARRLTGSQYGRSTFYVQTKYTNQNARILFLTDAGQPREISYYENAGRSALAAALKGNSGQEFRMQLAQIGTGDALWAQMKATGNVADFGPLFGLVAGSTDPRVAAAGSDYLTITNWASSMNRAAGALKEVDTLLGGADHPGVDDLRVTSARAHLKNCLEDVVSKTHDHFGDPLGLLMAYFAGLQLAAKNVMITGTQIDTLNVGSAAEAAAHV